MCSYRNGMACYTLLLPFCYGNVWEVSVFEVLKNVYFMNVVD